MTEIRHFYPSLTIITDNMGMDEGKEGDRPSIDLQRDNIKDTERQVDAIANAIAPSLVFAAVALPPNLADHLKSSLETKADQAREAAVEAGFVIPAAERLTDGRTMQERERDGQAKAISYAMLVMDEIEERRQREEANFQEWIHSRHTYAGQSMDGEDWHRLMTWFRDPANVTAWEDAMMAETGQSREEVRQTGGKMKRFYDLMEKDGRGTMTSAERTEFERLNADKDVKRGVEVQKEIQGLNSAHGHDQTAETEAAFDGSTDTRVLARASLNDDIAEPQGRLATVEPISSTYTELALGKAPALPAPKPVAPVAGNTVTISADNMFG